MKSVSRQNKRSRKGAGSKKNRHRLKSVFSGVTHRNVQTSLKSLPEKQSVNPIFDNVAPLKPICASLIQERHQIDLVDMSRNTEFYDGQELHMASPPPLERKHRDCRRARVHLSKRRTAKNYLMR